MKHLLVAVLAVFLGGCCTAHREYVEANVGTYELFTGPYGEKFPDGLLPTWIERGRASGELTETETLGLRLKLKTWKLANDEALKTLEEEDADGE